MKNIKEFTEDALEHIIPAAKNTGEYVCIIGKNAKNGFLKNKKRIKNYLSNKENKNRVLDILLIILIVLASFAFVLEIYNSVLKIKERKRRINSKND